MVPMVSHNEKCDVAPNFYHLDLRNAIVTSMKPCTSHNAGGCAIHVMATPMLMASHDQNVIYSAIDIT